MKVTAPSFKDVEAGSYRAVLIWAIGLGTHKTPFTNDHGDPVYQNQVRFTWEIDEQTDDGRPLIISQYYTLSINKKSNMGKLLVGWRGKEFAPGEEFEVENLLGQPCLLSVVINDKDRAVVAGASKMPKGMEALEPHNDLKCFDVSDPDWDVFATLPDWMQEKINASSEMSETAKKEQEQSNTQREPAKPMADDFDDDIPF